VILDELHQIHPERVMTVEWYGDELLYDLQLFELDGNEHEEFWILNPDYQIQKSYRTDLKYYIDKLPDTRKCIVVMYKDNWIAKIFKQGWYPYHGYETLEIVKPTMIWTKNPDLDKLMKFEDDPFGLFEPNRWDRDYKLVWYLDSRVNPLEEKIWAMSCEPIGNEIKGVKEMGTLMPLIDVEFNEHLPDIGVDINNHYPAYWELEYEHVYELDPIHQTDRQLWVMKYSPAYRKSKGWKWAGVVGPNIDIEYNPDLGKLNFDIEYTIPWHDFTYEHVWMLDNIHLVHGEEKEIWAFKIKASPNIEGSKIVDYISPSVKTEVNPEIKGLKFDIDYVVPWHDLDYEHVWMLDEECYPGHEPIWAVKQILAEKVVGSKEMGEITPNQSLTFNKSLKNLYIEIDYKIPYHDRQYEHIWYTDLNDELVWSAKLKAVSKPIGVKDMGRVEPMIPKQLDVVFISYHEPNAEKNWNRVLEKVPTAKRVNGVKGIFNAHRSAAEISETDMFYVVDGDAWLVDDWNFDFQPTLFDRDCAFIWHSVNPINGLTYGFGGVKLFSKSMILKSKKWTTLDFSTTVMPKLKVMDTISNVSDFNTDEFSTWRSAFRECTKLAYNLVLDPDSVDDKTRLETWLTVGEDQEFGYAAIDGASRAINFVNDATDYLQLLQINNRNWLYEQYNSFKS